MEVLIIVAGTSVRLKRHRSASIDADLAEKCAPTTFTIVPPVVRPIDGLRLDTRATAWYSNAKLPKRLPFEMAARRWLPITPGGR